MATSATEFYGASAMSSNSYLQSLANPKEFVPPTEQMGQQDFLRLLTTQLANQDPTKPMEPKEFITDMTQFANLQAVQDVNANFTSMQNSYLASQAVNSAVLIGKSVMAETDKLNYDGTKPVDLAVSSDSTYTDAQAVIVNDKGEIVKTWKWDSLSEGQKDLTWDGLDDNGNGVPPGDYRLMATAKDIEGNVQELGTQVATKITKVNMQNNANVQLVLSTGNSIPFSSVKQIGL